MYDTIIMRRSRQNRRFQVSPVTKGVAEELGLLSALSHSTLSRYKDLVLKRHVSLVLLTAKGAKQYHAKLAGSLSRRKTQTLYRRVLQN